MIDFGPDRLGHCCFLSKPQIKQVAELGIPVEICPTSGTVLTQCGLVNFLPALLEFNKLQHNIIIGCDDTLVFNTALGAEYFEYAKAVKAYDVETLKAMLTKNVDAIFFDDQEYKRYLKDVVIDKFKD